MNKIDQKLYEEMGGTVVYRTQEEAGIDHAQWEDNSDFCLWADNSDFWYWLGFLAASGLLVLVLTNVGLWILS